MIDTASVDSVVFQIQVTPHSDNLRFQIPGPLPGRTWREVSRELTLEMQSQWKRARLTWSGEPARLKDLGKALTAILPEEIHMALREATLETLSRGQQLKVLVTCEDPALADAPWEWLYLQAQPPFDLLEGHLALLPHVRVVRDARQAASLAADSPLRILVVVADPNSPRFQRLPWLAAEARSIASAFAALRGREVELKTLFDCMPAALEGMLADFRPQFVHFAGHGESRPRGGVLALHGPRANSERLVLGSTLGSWLADAGTQFVYLSACDTAGTEGSVAEALVASGIPAVVAMQTPVSDAGQPHLARIFYGSLLSGSRIDEAVAESRQASGDSSMAWASIVLYSCDPPLSLVATPSDVVLRRGLNNLPRFATSFVGREREAEDLARKIRESPLVVLTGPGGIGKTRLAVEAATLALKDYPDGVWHVNCSECSEEDDVLRAVSRTLELDHDALGTAEGVRDAVGARRMLLLLDGLESVVATGRQRVVHRLLAAPSLSLLITSRFEPGLSGEEVYKVLPLGRSNAFGQELIVRAAKLDIQTLSNAERESVANICSLLEGVPLALVIAAGRLKFLSVFQLESLLRKSPLATLGGKSGDVGDALRRSLELVPTEDVRLLRRLAVFTGSFSWTEVAEVYPDDQFEFLEGLSNLADRSLLQPEGSDEARRYRILEPLREYVNGLGENGFGREDRHRGREGHLLLFVNAAEDIARLMEEGRWAEGTRSLWEKLPNLRSAFEYAAAAGRDDEIEKFCRALILSFTEAAMWRDFERFAAAGHEAAARSDRPRLSSYIYSLEGVMRSHRGDYFGAETIWKRRVELCRSIGNSIGASDALLDLAAHAVAADKTEDAKHWIDEAAVEVEKADRDDMRAVLAAVRCRFYDQIGNVEQAMRFGNEAEALLDQATFASQHLFVFTNLARVWRQPSDRWRIRNAMGKILEESVAGERRIQAANALKQLALIFAEDGHIVAAARGKAAVVGLYRELGSHRLRQAEKDLGDYRSLHPDSIPPEALLEPWPVLVRATLSHLSVLATEEPPPPS